MKPVHHISGIVTLLLLCIAGMTPLKISKSATLNGIQSWIPLARQISQIFKPLSIEGRNLPVTTHERKACTMHNALLVQA